MDVSGKFYVLPVCRWERSPVLTTQEAAWVPQHVWTYLRKKRSSPCWDSDPGSFENYSHSSVVANTLKYNMRLLCCILGKREVKNYTLFGISIAIQKFQEFMHENHLWLLAM